MALSKETARKIIEAVALNPDCRKSIDSYPALEIFKTISPTYLLLRFSHLAGSVRNMGLVAKSMFLGKKLQDDPEATSLLCIGITTVTVIAIHIALKQKKIPEVHTASGIHRVHWGVHHEATWIRMKDDSEYVFDWHATLKIQDPAISKAEDWVKAQKAINYVLFSGFK